MTSHVESALWTLNKFLVWHKKFGPAQNILEPVKGQGINDYNKTTMTTDSKKTWVNELRSMHATNLFYSSRKLLLGASILLLIFVDI